MGKMHDALFAAKLAGGSGGSGGTSDYSDLTNKPSINSVTLSGNKTSTDLGLQPTIDSTHKLSADLVDDTSSTNKLVHIDNAGGLWVGLTQYIKIMDRASYDASTKENMIYLVYPTPPANLSTSASPRGVETLETPTEIEPDERGDDNANLQADNGADEMR